MNTKLSKADLTLLLHRETKSLAQDLYVKMNSLHPIENLHLLSDAQMLICWILKHPSYLNLSLTALKIKVYHFIYRHSSSYIDRSGTFAIADWLSLNSVRILLSVSLIS